MSHPGDILIWETYILTQFRVITYLLGLFFLPINQNVDYDFSMSHSFWEWPVLISFLFLLTLLVLACRLKKKWPLFSFGIFWFFLTISVNFIPRQHIIAEQQLYLPSIGLCLTFCAGLFYAMSDVKKLTVVLFSILMVLSVLTYHRNQVWGNEITLWQDVVKKSPQKPRGYLNLAGIYLKEKKYDLAIKTFTQLLSITPDNTEGYSGRGLAYQNMGKSLFALQDFNQAILLDNKNAIAYLNRGNLDQQLGKIPEALADYDLAIKNKQKEIKTLESQFKKDAAKKEYAVILNSRAVIYLKSNQFGLASKDLDEALKNSPNFVEALVNRGNLFFQQGQFQQALENYDQALKLQPDHEIALKNRAVLVDSQK